DLVREMGVDEGPLLETTCHIRSPPTLLRPAPHDVLVGLILLLTRPRFRLAPGADRVAASRGLAFTATQGVIDRVHGHTPGLGANALPAVAAGLTQLDQLGFGVAHLANGGPAVERHHPHLPRGEAQEC